MKRRIQTNFSSTLTVSSSGFDNNGGSFNRQMKRLSSMSMFLLLLSQSLPTTEAFTTSSSLRQHSKSPTVSSSSNSKKSNLATNTIQSSSPILANLPFLQQRQQQNQKKMQQQQYDYNDYEKQSHLFQIVAKYKEIQNQLSNFNLNTSSSSRRSISSSRTIQQSNDNNNNNNNNNNEFDKDEVATLLDKQAQALQISKSTLTYIQLKGQKAREEILLSNMGLVHSTVNKFIYKLNNRKNNNSKSMSNRRKQQYNILNNINKDDLIQEGMIGLTKAIDKFDPSRKIAFSTYATYWIEGYVIRYMKQKSNFVHIPEYMQSIISKLERKVYELASLEGWNVHGSTTSSSTTTKNVDTSSFTEYENRILQDESKLNWLCTECKQDIKTIQMAFKVRKTMYNTKSNSIIELDDWMMKDHQNNSIQQDVAVWNRSYDDSDIGGSSSSSEEVVLERYQTILGQFISMKEMEALSWRYGLLKQEDGNDSILEQQQQQQQQQLQCSSKVDGGDGRRDYEAEAENDLFGPGGILNSSASTSASSSSSSLASISSKTKVKTSISTSPFTTTSSSSFKNKQSIMGPNKGGRWGEAMSFNEVGQQMRVSAEYGRRLCASALKKLTKAVEEGRLDPAMLF